MSNLGKNLKQARLTRGLSQDDVAGVIGLTRPTYALVEAGKRDITLSQAETLAAVLRVSEDEGLRCGVVYGVSTLTDPMSSVEKYKQIILNALQAGSDDDGKITKTKLAKLVYLADFNWYYEHLTPMSGMSYRKLPRGPVTDVYFRALDELEEDGVIDREEKGNAILFSLMESGTAPANRFFVS